MIKGFAFRKFRRVPRLQTIGWIALAVWVSVWVGLFVAMML